MILHERESRLEYIENAVRQMMAAARTAPKAKGMDVVEIAAVTGEDIGKLAARTRELGTETGMKFLWRDADNITQAGAVLLVGTRPQLNNLNCGHCGYQKCADKPAPVPCAINSVDVGIALGSACATAADLRLDTRVMFSVGLAAQKLGWLPECQTVFAIPLSVSSKNPFFDRVRN